MNQSTARIEVQSVSHLSQEISFRNKQAEIFKRRKDDWRMGPVVYQIFPDRFAIGRPMDGRREAYSAPKKLRNWSDQPSGGIPIREFGVWSHELDFWGGDLKGIESKVAYLKNLGIDVVYLNPITPGLTNHKYDSADWKGIAPEFGNLEDFRSLARSLHAQKMKLMLDGVFNHAGKTHPQFQQALKDPASKFREWFVFGSQFPAGYRSWAGVANLPEAKLESESLRKYLWKDRDSVVAHFLREGADGWRLDVASEIGFEYLSELTDSAHRHKKGSWVVGEAWTYPERWTQAMDGLMNIHLGQMLFSFAGGELTSGQFAKAMDQMVVDCGIEALLKSWNVVSNHDMPRIGSRIRNESLRRMIVGLQMTLPGSPQIYYGDEIGLLGGNDPANRGPMNWDLVQPTNTTLSAYQSWIQTRKDMPALRYGDYRSLATDQLFAFVRTTNDPTETVIVVANPTNRERTETLPVPVSTLLGYTLFRDRFSSKEARVLAGTLRVAVPAQSIQVYQMDSKAGSHDQYKRLRINP